MSDIQGLGLVILVFSSLFTVGQLYTLRRARQSAKWPQTTGRIILSSLAPVSLTDRSFSDVQPLIRYRYSVGGTQYEGQTLSIGEGWWRSWGTKLPIRVVIDVDLASDWKPFPDRQFGPPRPPPSLADA